MNEENKVVPNYSIQNVTLLNLSIQVKVENLTDEKIEHLRHLVYDIMEGTSSFFQVEKSQKD